MHEIEFYGPDFDPLAEQSAHLGGHQQARASADDGASSSSAAMHSPFADVPGLGSMTSEEVKAQQAAYEHYREMRAHGEVDDAAACSAEVQQTPWFKHAATGLRNFVRFMTVDTEDILAARSCGTGNKTSVASGARDDVEWEADDLDVFSRSTSASAAPIADTPKAQSAQARLRSAKSRSIHQGLQTTNESFKRVASLGRAFMGPSVVEARLEAYGRPKAAAHVPATTASRSPLPRALELV